MSEISDKIINRMLSKNEELSMKVIDLTMEKDTYKLQYLKLVHMVKDIKASLEGDEFIKENDKEYLFENLKNYVNDYIRDNNVKLDL